MKVSSQRGSQRAVARPSTGSSASSRGRGGSYDERWAAAYDEFRRWVDAHGVLPRQRGRDETESRLGEWARTQRRARNRGGLAGDRATLLEQVPGWAWQRHDQRWDQTFHEYRRWRSTHRRHPRSEGGDDTETALGWWATRQRQSYRAGTLQDVRVARLELLPDWDWDPYGSEWDAALQAYLRWLEHHDGLRPTARSSDPTERTLGEWARGQRRAHRKGELPDDRAERLAAVAGWQWDVEPVWGPTRRKRYAATSASNVSQSS